MDIREITPCIGCPRNCHPLRLDESESQKAASFLLTKALDSAAIDSQDDALRQDVDDIQTVCGSRYTTKRALSAVASCGSRIGAGECESWQLDQEKPQITSIED
ncbi:hypothetical protein KC953_03450 [Candidatus Saccharibacteria bacterium]|nr:hypothetical protein [Candidatus Saccharibacteria bacterium]